ncbi:site-2 protease family protein [Candidatus Kaiserbacteria bacterium]|nr:site-2 protease family protein [Candidatus Kaiserbacteria bacterium]
MTALLVIAILVLLIVVHELGHFIVAKIFRVRVDEFGLGYPPRAFTFGKIGGTEYTLNWIPFGGFVRLFGEESPPAGGERGKGSLVDASRWVQAGILIAGVAANAVLAWFLFAAALHIGIPAVVDHAEPGEVIHLYVSDIVPGSPASSGGIAAGDEIVGMQDTAGSELVSLTPDSALEYVRVRGGQPIEVTYLHEGRREIATMRPANAVAPDAAGRPALGIGLVLVANRALPWSEALPGAVSATTGAFTATATALYEILRGMLTGSANLSGVVGPVGLVSVIGDASRSGLGNVLKLAAFISVNLAIINLVPIPALDGGRLLILAVEGIMRRRAHRLAVQVLNAFGIALIIMLMLVVTYHDVGRLLA